MSTDQFERLDAYDVVLDALPDEVVATVQRRDAWLRELQSDSGGLEFLVSDVLRWTPGQHVRVAFLGGNTALHQDIVEATKQITESCNLILDFGFDQQSGTFRTWSTQDTQYTAEIRVTFDKSGFFSLVGTNSIDPDIGSPAGDVGGRPGQCSLNLGGFHSRRPPNWQGVVRHEFLHALAFHHSHQNMRGPCEQVFRWEDDQGYVPTKDAQGQFIVDADQRRPGIYTYLSGAPNFWSRQKVDSNLRTQENPDVVAGPFDRKSVMLYRFPPLFYKSLPSECAPDGDGISLSEGDRRGLQLLYPGATPDIDRFVERRHTVIELLESTIDPLEGLESTAGTGHAAFAPGVAELLRRTLRQTE